MTTQSELHARKIRDVALDYLKAGYDVITDPKPQNYPFDLLDFHPDLIAKKNGEGLVIEVKSDAAKLPVDRLKAVAETVSQHKGWRFLLITLDDAPGTSLPGIDADGLSWVDVADRIAKANQLAESGDYETAFISLWIGFEQMLRLQALHQSLPVERFQTSLVIRHLYSFGEISAEQLDAALQCQNIRNHVIHGAKVTDLQYAFTQLKSLVLDLQNEWALATTA